MGLIYTDRHVDVVEADGMIWMSAHDDGYTVAGWPDTDAMAETLVKLGMELYRRVKHGS